MATAHLTVQIADSTAYPVLIGPGLLSDVLPRFVAERAFSSAAVITNETLAPLYGGALADRLPGGFVISVPDGEVHKTLHTVQSMYDALLAQRADRSTLIIALGGGVIGDIAGFAAATFMRGLPLVQAPTSLLAMVDASIGGKVGVDLPQGKNLVGAFKDPLAVMADTSVLATLPDVEFRCGLAEVVKAALIADPDLLDHLLSEGPTPIEQVIERAARVKIDIVQKDPLETGIRAVLNLGHTFGHALEQVSGYNWRHGEAVALGLMAAARLSEALGVCSSEAPSIVERVLRHVGLPVRYRGYEPAALIDAMRHDKKWRGGNARFILLRAPGDPMIRDDIPISAVRFVLEGLREA